MSQRVRDRGPRRRCSSNRTLVRTIPALQQEPPPVPLQGSTWRDAIASTVADSEGIATGSWSTIDVTFPPGTAVNPYLTHVLYHHATVGNQRTDSYDVILPPVRLTLAATATDGALYDFWFGTRGSANSLYRTPQTASGVEICPSPLPSDSHCEWPEGFTSVQLPTVAFFLGTTQGYNQLNAIAPTTSISAGVAMSVEAVKFYVNGVAGSRIDKPTGRQRVPISKGDTFYCDIWYRMKKSPDPAFSTSSGKMCIFVPLYNVFSGRKYWPTGSESGALSHTIAFYNLNTSPDFNPTDQTYEITIAGHADWTLKDGTNGPHKMATGGGWTRDLPLPGWLRWRNGGQEISLFFSNEIPYVRLFGVGPFGVAAAYRPSFGSSTSYRKTTTNLIVQNGNGSTNCAAATVLHVPSGVWDQAGTTTFDLCWPPTGNFTGTLYGYRSGPTPFPNSEVPTSITLTRVSL